jgi:hypothetical protein
VGELREEGPDRDRPDRLVPGDAEAPEEDLVRQYLREIGRYPLLAKDEEVELAKAIEAGNHAQALLNTRKRKPTAERGAELQRRIAAGRAARRRFIESNLRLVVSMAKTYSVPGLPLLDLIQEGTWGSSGESRSSTTGRASSSRRTPLGGSARRSPEESPIRRARSGSRSTSSRPSTGCAGPKPSWLGSSSVIPGSRRLPRPLG